MVGEELHSMFAKCYAMLWTIIICASWQWNRMKASNKCRRQSQLLQQQKGTYTMREMD